MYFIKQYILIKKIIRKIIKYISKSRENAYLIGLEFSLLYYYIHDEKQNNISDYETNINIIVKQFLLNCKNNTEDKLILNDFILENINYKLFLELFNKKLFTINKEILASYFRGYYLNSIDLYGTNIVLIESKLEFNTFDSYYFVLYDFHILYLDYIYKSILIENLIPYKIKLLVKTEYDKYSINEVTDDTNYKLVFIHKKKYYYNSIKLIFEYLFYNINSESELYYPEEIKIYKLYKNLF